MAYQAKRKRLYEEEFQLCEEDGTIVQSIQVSLDADSMVKKICDKQIDLIQALEQMGKAEANKEGVEILGNAVISLLEAVFGAEDSKVILDFYNERYIDLCQEVVPFITETVIPEVRKIAKENKKSTIKKYNRTQRRVLKFGRK